MPTFLKAADLTQEQSIELIDNLQPNNDRQPGYVWLEAPDGWAFDWWDWKADLKRTLDEHGQDFDQIETDSTNNEEEPINTLCWYSAGWKPVKEPAYDCLTRSTAGRLFAPTGELRWRTIPALGATCWRVVFLGDIDWVGPALADHSDTLNELHPHEDHFFLWGQQTERAPDEWIELRIPHRFRYPVPGKPNRVKVRVEEWRNDTGTPHFFRLCDLEPCEEEM